MTYRSCSISIVLYYVTCQMQRNIAEQKYKQVNKCEEEQKWLRKKSDGDESMPNLQSLVLDRQKDMVRENENKKR